MRCIFLILITTLILTTCGPRSALGPAFLIYPEIRPITIELRSFSFEPNHFVILQDHSPFAFRLTNTADTLHNFTLLDSRRNVVLKKDLIPASIKMPPEGYYILESHSYVKEGYSFLFNIDGQAIIWKIEGKSEITPRWDENGKIIPEGGQGIRYVLDKKIRLRPGSHHLFFGLLEEKYYTEFEISLREGEPHTLEFRPLYAMSRKGVRSFYHGIKSCEVFLDGTYVK